MNIIKTIIRTAIQEPKEFFGSVLVLATFFSLLYIGLVIFA
jgi:hypothetical protein